LEETVAGGRGARVRGRRFRGGSPNEAQVDLLHRQIGQLKVPITLDSSGELEFALLCMEPS
jgi:hypothetical protein